MRIGRYSKMTIEEFKNMKTRAQVLEEAKDKGVKLSLYTGKTQLSEEAHKKQCENLKVGDTVFFLVTKDMGKGEEDGLPRVDVTITQDVIEA